jgi:hypothetical protein
VKILVRLVEMQQLVVQIEGNNAIRDCRDQFPKQQFRISSLFHFILQGLFNRLAFGDVIADRYVSIDFPELIAFWDNRGVDPIAIAILVTVSYLATPGAAAANGLPHIRKEFPTVKPGIQYTYLLTNKFFILILANFAKFFICIRYFPRSIRYRYNSILIKRLLVSDQLVASFVIGCRMGQDPIFRLNNIGQIAAPAIGFLKNHWHDSQHVRSSENVL